MKKGVILIHTKNLLVYVTVVFLCIIHVEGPLEIFREYLPKLFTLDVLHKFFEQNCNVIMMLIRFATTFATTSFANACVRQHSEFIFSRFVVVEEVGTGVVVACMSTSFTSPPIST